jgi:hypothetical protein
VIDEQDGLQAFVLRFENGAKIVAGSSNPKFFRGKGGDADGDEFAFHRPAARAVQGDAADRDVLGPPDAPLEHAQRRGLLLQPADQGAPAPAG